MNQLRFLALTGGMLLLASCNSPQSYLTKGDAYFKEGKYTDASINYRKAIQKNVSFGEAYLGLGRTEVRLGNAVAAIQSLQRAVELMPTSDEPKVALGDLCLGGYVSAPSHPKFLYDTVSRMSQQILSKDPNSFDGLRYKGYIAMFDRKPEEALEAFRKADQAKPKQPEVMLVITQLLFQTSQAESGEKLAQSFIGEKKDFGALYDVLYSHFLSTGRTQEAEDLLKSKVASNPKKPEFLVQLASHYFRQKNRPAMLATLQKLLDNPSDFPQAHLQVGDFYTAVGDAAEARRQYEEGAKATSEDQLTYQKRVIGLLIAQGKRAEALPLLGDLVKANPKDASIRTLRAGLLLESGSAADRDIALTEFLALTKEKPEVATLHFALGQAYLRKGQVPEAVSQFKEAIQRNKGLMPARFALAEISRRGGDMKELLRITNEILAIKPGDLDARFYRSIALTGNGDFDQADRELTSLLTDTKDVTARYVAAELQLGLLRTSQKRYQEAEAIFRKYDNGRNDNDLRPVQGLSELYIAQGQPERALATWQNALKKAPDAPTILTAAADAAARAHQWDLALGYMQKVLEKQPDSTNANALVGQLYQNKGDINSAIASFTKAQQLGPKDPRPTLLLAMALESAGRKTEAIAAYRQAYSLAHDNPVVLNNLAYLLADTGGDLDEALKMAQQAQRSNPDVPNFSDTLGWIYAKKNMQDSAIQIFNNLVRKYPASSTYSFHLGYALLQKGDRAAAKNALMNALARKPSKEEESKIRELISTLG
jgi:tetratricopeptide (TPR) repeat protein